ncbi:type VII secretion target [Allorhizocola rhizosphaerae]|uniref:type VII secretion target n=1 Tax=Allorhizocola rhizosphaerae TaxID=1872709 RepID=UPI0013C2D4D0|nr:type VII secretion target [Allorhizocola rhizosphaerae]
MAFEADHERIKNFGSHVKGLSDDADEAVRYVDKHLGIGYNEGRMFFTIVEQAENVRNALKENYTHLSEVAMKSGIELGKAADFYRTTDQASAERLDGTYR